MIKSQKIWLWISIIMFIIPEIFFSFVPNFFYFMQGYGNFPSLVVKIFGNNFLEAHSTLVSILLVCEYFSLVYLFIYNIKFNKNYKFITALFLGVILIILSLNILLVYSISHLNW